MSHKNVSIAENSNQSTSLPLNQGALSALLKDLKSLIKLKVLIANVIPIFAGFWLALYFTGTSLNENINLFLLTMIGGTFVMAGALVLNNWYDVDIDRIMDRTKSRPTVTGNISLNVVLMVGIGLSIVGIVLLLFTNIEVVFYAFIGWFTYVILYTMWSKRRYAMNTIIGSVSGAVTPLIGWAAIAPAFDKIPIMLFILLFIWQMPHTYAIAIRKYDEYKVANVAMLPVVKGIQRTKWHMLIYVILLLPLAFFLTELGTGYMIISSILTLSWLAIIIRGFFAKDVTKWAYVNFLVSVNYMTLLFLTMIIVTWP